MNDINKTGGKIWMWEARTGKVVPFNAKEMPLVFRVAFSPDGKVLAALLPKPKGLGQSSWVRVAILNAATGETRQIIETTHKGGITGITFSADSRKLATVSVDATACVWDWEASKLTATCKLDRQGTAALDFNSDGTRLAVASGQLDSIVQVFDAATGASLFPCSGLKGATVVDWSDDGKWIIGGNYQNDVCIWDASNGKEAGRVKGVSGQIAGVAFSPDSKRFFTVDFHGLDINHGLQAWNIADVVRPNTNAVPPMPKKETEKTAAGPSQSEQIESIRKLLQDPDVRNRRLGLAEAGKLGGAKVELVDDLLTLFNDPDTQVRNTARGWLLNLGRPAKAAVPAFLELYRNGTAEERKFAEAALRNIDPSALKK